MIINNHILSSLEAELNNKLEYLFCCGHILPKCYYQLEYVFNAELAGF
jgi:hypothetical protein